MMETAPGAFGERDGLYACMEAVVRSEEYACLDLDDPETVKKLVMVARVREWKKTERDTDTVRFRLVPGNSEYHSDILCRITDGIIDKALAMRGRKPGALLPELRREEERNG